MEALRIITEEHQNLWRIAITLDQVADPLRIDIVQIRLQHGQRLAVAGLLGRGQQRRAQDVHGRLEQLGRDAWTDVETARMTVEPAIPAEVFSASVLEREGDEMATWPNYSGRVRSFHY